MKSKLSHMLMIVLTTCAALALVVGMNGCGEESLVYDTGPFCDASAPDSGMGGTDAGDCH